MYTPLGEKKLISFISSIFKKRVEAGLEKETTLNDQAQGQQVEVNLTLCCQSFYPGKDSLLFADLYITFLMRMTSDKNIG